MTYDLVQHEADGIQLELDFRIRLEHTPNTLQLNYQILGNLENLILPKTNTQIKRADNLWQNTCFEAFFKLKDSPNYIEFNLSPFSAYNVYFFDSYRQGMQEIDIANIKLTSSSSTNNYNFTAKIELADNYSFEALSITTILKLQSDKISHWAIKHTGSKPDFHLPDSFIPL